jgi:hypothetical protein
MMKAGFQEKFHSFFPAGLILKIKKARPVTSP